MFKVTVKFERMNSRGKLETSVREGTLSAPNRDEAKKRFLKQFRANEPNRRKIIWTKVVNVETGRLT